MKSWIIKPALVALAGTFLLAAGLLRKEGLVVLTKAAAVCLECIGIG